MREKHGMTGTPEYHAWSNMVSRCHGKSHQMRYTGKRGIHVCQRWRESFMAFLSDVGSRPSPNHSLDRVDNDSNYAPENVRWATQTQQCRNMMTTHRLNHHGRNIPRNDLAEQYGINKDALRFRLKRGMPLDLALTLKPQRGKRLPGDTNAR